MMARNHADSRGSWFTRKIFEVHIWNSMSDSTVWKYSREFQAYYLFIYLNSCDISGWKILSSNRIRFLTTFDIYLQLQESAEKKIGFSSSNISQIAYLITMSIHLLAVS